MKRWILRLAALGLLWIGVADQTWAGPIPVANHSFEDPVLAPYTYTSNVVPDWTGIGFYGISYRDNPPSLLDPAPDGNQEAYLNGNALIFQDLGVSVVSGDQYVLDLFVGSPKPELSLWRVELLAGSVAFASASGVIAGTGHYYPIQVLGVGVGSGDLGIRLSETAGGTQVVYDDVRLAENGPSAVPEPATLTLLGIGIAGMAGYGWRRRKLAAT